MTSRLLFIIGLSLLTAHPSLYGQIKFIKTKGADLPGNLKYQGQVTKAIKWEDNLGVNYLLVTEDNKPDEDAEFKTNVIPRFYHYIAKDTGYRLIWSFFDSHPGYPLRFVDKAFNITDLDGNGTAEVWYMYQWLYIDSTVQSTKIIMNENSETYEVWGDERIEDKPENERYTFEYGLKNYNGAFKDFAVKLWEQYYQQ